VTARAASLWRSGARLLTCISIGIGTVGPVLAADVDLVKRGEYLAQAGDCIACHSAPGGRPMAGGVPLPTPVGVIVSTNITPSKTRGIGSYTLEQFAAALRRGVRSDGARLYPAMPYTAYARVTDDDVRALYAYFMKGVAPVDIAPMPTHLPFPFNIRASMRIWNAMYLNTTPFQPEPAQSAAWNRGAYLARGLAHCSACHSPRGLLMAEDESRELGGGAVGPWQASNITSDINSGIGGWTVAELATYLRDGHAAGKGQAAGPMAEAVDFSLRHLVDADLSAIATYLKTVPAIRDPRDEKPPYQWGAPSDDLASIRGVALPRDADQMSGAQLYDAYCATCHQARGEGSFDGGLPALFHNTAVGRRNSDNLVMVVLRGVHREPEVNMPAFDRTLSDRQITSLVNYLTRRWGNPAAVTSVEQVKALRRDSPASVTLITIARIGLGVAVLLVVLVAGIAIFGHMRRSGHSAT
jgi:mono/diheme cytochrome c family protein